MQLFIPGPVSVNERTLKASCHEMIGHRSGEFQELFSEVSKGLQKVFQTQNRVLVSTSSGSGLMEAAVRNCVDKKVLVCSCGAFGKKWFNIAKSCGKDTGLLEAEPGKAIHPEEMKEKIGGGYEAVCITHNETSTGVQNSLEEIAPIVKESGALLCVDAVSSMGGTNIPVDELGIDVCVTSSQKCFALPPGLAFGSVSEKALEKAKSVEGKGYYFDFTELAKSYDKNETPYTPGVSQLFGLREKLKEIFEEGLEKRFARHEMLAERTRAWVITNGFELFAEEGYRSPTVTCVSNTRGTDFEEIKRKIKEKGYILNTGYGKLNDALAEQEKPTTMRIPHMGELTLEELNKYLKTVEEMIG